MSTDERSGQDMLVVSEYVGLEERIARIEEQDRVRHQQNAIVTD